MQASLSSLRSLTAFVVLLSPFCGKKPFFFSEAADAADGFPPQTSLVLTESLMDLIRASGQLSSLAYEENPAVADSDFQLFSFYDEEPDQALVALHNGYCFAAFRGTTLTWNDWQQNLAIGNDEVCNDHQKTCCTTRTGFYQAYDTSYRHELEQDIRKCARSCSNKDECVVLTGHSQGGAIAAVAGVALADLNPYVITFGQPATIDHPCPLIRSERWYRLVNTKESETLHVGISYDPVPFVPGLGADFFGHMIMLGDDDTGVANIGLDAQTSFGPLNIAGFEAHNMNAADGSEFPGYNDRIAVLMSHNSFPIRSDGFKPGTLCSENIECETQQCGKEHGFSYARCIGTDCKDDIDCELGRCEHGVCVPPLGSCMACNENSDCASNICTWRYKCTNMDGLMDDECECIQNSDCVSGRCEGVSNPVCEAKLGGGMYCNESSDCQSGRCTWWFRCTEPVSMTARSASLEQVGEALKRHKKAKSSAAVPEDSNAATTKTRWEGLVLIMCVVFIVFWTVRWYTNRRKGYEQIPTSLNV